MEVTVYVHLQTAVLVPSFLLPCTEMQRRYPDAEPRWVAELANDQPACGSLERDLFVAVPLAEAEGLLADVRPFDEALYGFGEH